MSAGLMYSDHKICTNVALKHKKNYSIVYIYE